MKVFSGVLMVHLLCCETVIYAEIPFFETSPGAEAEVEKDKFNSETFWE